MKFARPSDSDQIFTLSPKLNEILLHLRPLKIRSTWIAYQTQIYTFQENQDKNFEKIRLYVKYEQCIV